MNGDLLAETERHFDVLITTDKNLRYQQNLAGRKLAILVLPSASWPKLQTRVKEIAATIDSLAPGDYIEL